MLFRSHGRAGVVGHLLEDVLERGGKGHAVADREAEAVGLPGSVVGVLADHDHLEPVEGALVESPEYVAAAREDAVRGVLLPHEVGQRDEVGFLEFGGQEFFPVRGHLYIHKVSVFVVKVMKSSRNPRCGALFFGAGSSRRGFSSEMWRGCAAAGIFYVILE